MRYQIFDQATATSSKLSSPWRWLARYLCGTVTLRWQYCRMVDSKTGEVLMEWATAERWVPSANRDGAAIPTNSHIRIRKDGNKEAFIACTTVYGKGCAPEDGHPPRFGNLTSEPLAPSALDRYPAAHKEQDDEPPNRKP